MAPDVASLDAEFRHALTVHRAGDPAAAAQLYSAILEMDPRHAGAMHLLGVTHAQRGQYDEACQLIAAALRLDPGSVEARSNLASAQHERARTLATARRFRAALAAYDDALALRPDHVDTLNGRGTALAALDRPHEALASYDRAIALAPDYAQAHGNRGSVLAQLGRFDEALASYAAALAIAPDYAEAYYNRGRTLHERGRFEEAIASYERALARAPGHADAHVNRGNALRELGRFEEALDSYAAARRAAPGHVDAHCNEGLCRLLLGDLRRGWDLYEWRWQQRVARPRRYTDYAAWQGEDVDGRLLAWSEQGPGDTMFFAGMIPDLIPRARRLVVQVEPRLADLFSRSFPEVEIIGHDAVGPPAGGDRAIPLGSVGRHVRGSLSDIPDVVGYLKADPARIDALRRRLAHGSLVVGLSWISKNPESGARRSLALAGWSPVLGVPGCTFVDLQYGDTTTERAELARSSGRALRHLDVDAFADIDGLAALIAACDLVMTIDNTTAHLAAALGKPTWVLLPFVPDWRWLLVRDDSPWYPTMRLFRQPSIADWPSVMARVAGELSQLTRREGGRDP